MSLSLSYSLNSEQDIPTLTAEAAANHPGIGYFVAAPLGLHPLMTTIVDSRLETCLARLTTGGACCICFGCAPCDGHEHFLFYFFNSFIF